MIGSRGSLSERRLIFGRTTAVSPASGQSIGNQVFPFTPLVFGVVDIDQLGMWDSGLNTRLTVQEPGVYLVSAGWAHNYASGTLRDNIISINKVAIDGTSHRSTKMRYLSRFACNNTISATFPAVRGDYFTVTVYQATTATRTTVAAHTFLAVTRVG